MDYAIKGSVQWQRLVRFVSLRFNGDDAEDLLQTAYLRMCERRAVHDIKNRDAYLIKTAINAGIDQARRSRLIDHSVDDARLATVSDTAPGQEETLSSRQRLIQVREVLNAMKPRTRDILLMHRLEGMTYREISKKLGITQSAVEKQISKGMRQLLAVAGDADEQG